MNGALQRSAGRAAIVACLLTSIPVTLAQQGDSKRAFPQAIDAAEASREAALAAARRDYDRVAAALETASAALTPGARRRLETGPLAKARRAHSAQAEAA